MALTAGSNEIIFWEDKPSHLVYFWKYALYLLGSLFALIFIGLVPIISVLVVLFFIFKAFECYWEISNTHYFLSHERLRIVRGGLVRGRRTFDIERHRLMDIELHEPFLHQILGLGIIEIKNFQWDKENVTLNGVKNPRAAREIIRGVATKSKNVTTYDMIDLSKINRLQQSKRLK